MILQQSTAFTRMLFLGAGLTTPAVQISKAGGAFAAPAGVLTAVGTGGWYSLALTSADTNTRGALAYAFSAAAGTPANPPDNDLVGGAPIDLTPTVPMTGNGANSVGDCLNAARAQGFGKWAISGDTLTLYGSDGTTVVRTFTLDSSSAPTQRT
jgi:hypothetical protein